MELKPTHSKWNERRAHHRVESEIGVKLRRSARAVFSGGRTIDVSEGGALIELIGPRKANPGERIAIAFENLHCPVTRAARMLGAQIVRVDIDSPISDRQIIAIKFDALQAGLSGLGRSAA